MSKPTFEDLLTEDAEILYDCKTKTTRWVVWKQVTTGRLSLALVQKDQVVSVNIGNLLHFCAKILPGLMEGKR